MSTNPPSNAKVYDRPERKGPSPIVLLVGLAIFAILGFFAYRAYFASRTPAAPPPSATTPGVSLLIVSPRLENGRAAAAGIALNRALPVWSTAARVAPVSIHEHLVRIR